MYLHLGDEVIASYDEIIGIFDLDAVTVAAEGRKFLRQAERGGRIVNISENLPKSFIVCEKNNREIVYISPISSATLQKRVARGIGGEDLINGNE